MIILDNFFRCNQVITRTEDCIYTDHGKHVVEICCNNIEDKMMNFKNPQDEKNEMYVKQMIDFCKKNESIHFYAMVLMLLNVNKHIYGNA